MKQTKKCKTCGKIFEKKINCSKRDWINSVKYCSRTCVNYSRPSPFKGMTNRWSEKWKKKMSENNIGFRSNTGRTHIKKGQHLSPKTEFGKIPAWNKGKKNPHFTGPNNPRWKGGIYPEHLKQRHSVEMKRWRIAVFERDSFTCQSCWRMSKKGDGVVLHAHHIKPFAKFPDLRFVLENGITLCRECHLKTDTHRVKL